MSVHPLFPGEAAFILRPSPANFSRGPQPAPEAPYTHIDTPYIEDDYTPHVNNAPRDEVLFNYTTRQVWLMMIGANALLALLVIGAAWMGVTV